MNSNSSNTTDSCANVTTVVCQCSTIATTPITLDFFSSTDFYVGLALALSSSIFIGSSFIIKKKGLLKLARHGNLRAGKGGHGYLKDWLWWAGFLTMGLGEILNFIAYAFAPATLVTPLGAFSVLIGTIMSSHFLKERLNLLGKMSCFTCVMGSIVIILHAPKEGYLANLDELMNKMQELSFIIYFLFTVIFTLVLIFYLGPSYGHRFILIYILICSFLGSLSVLGCKGLGIALRETIAGTNELNNWLTWVCLFVVIFCIVLQTHYLNKTLDIFSAALVTSIFYVTFTTCVIFASAILFNEWSHMSVSDVLGCLSGFSIVISAVFILHAFKDVDISLSERFQRNKTETSDLDGSVREKLLGIDNRPLPYNSSTQNGKSSSEPDLLDHVLYG